MTNVSCATIRCTRRPIAILMRLHTIDGNHAAGCRVYHTCVTALERDWACRLALRQSRPTGICWNLERHATPTPVLSLGLPISSVARPSGRPGGIVGAACSVAACIASVYPVNRGIGKTRLAEEMIRWAEQGSRPRPRAPTLGAAWPMRCWSSYCVPRRCGHAWANCQSSGAASWRACSRAAGRGPRTPRPNR